MGAAIVTGASSGIGAGIARALAEDGFGVALAARSPRALGAVATELGPTAVAVPTDVTSASDVERLVDTAVQRFEGLDVVVTCAGAYLEQPLERTTERDWDHVLEVNLKGTYLIARAALAHLRHSGGWLIGMSSLSGTVGEVVLERLTEEA